MHRFSGIDCSKICNYISLYRWPIHPADIFDQFPDNLELIIDEVVNNNPLLLILGNLNVK